MNINYAQQYPPKPLNPSQQGGPTQQQQQLNGNGNYHQNISTGISGMNLNQNNPPNQINPTQGILPPSQTNTMNNFNANTGPPPLAQNYGVMNSQAKMGVMPPSGGQHQLSQPNAQSPNLVGPTLLVPNPSMNQSPLTPNQPLNNSTPIGQFQTPLGQPQINQTPTGPPQVLQLPMGNNMNQFSKPPTPAAPSTPSTYPQMTTPTGLQSSVQPQINQSQSLMQPQLRSSGMIQPPNTINHPNSVNQPQHMMSPPLNLMNRHPNAPPNNANPNMMSQAPNMMNQQQNRMMGQPAMAVSGQYNQGGPPFQQNSMPQPGFNSQPNPYGYMPGKGMSPTNMSGVPPQANQQNMMYPYQSQTPPVQRLDPDQMPNPIQVMIENQNNADRVFQTNQPGLLPPLVTTKFTTEDQGNSSPRFVRSSMYSIPATPELLKTTALPFTLIISPFAKLVEGELSPPIVNFGELGPIRCIRCKAYMSPNMQFIDAGRRFQCLLCKAISEVPSEYFQHLDHTGQRVDKFERPELVLGTYEFIATKDYCRDSTFPNPPAYIFIIDVSYNNIKSGLVELLCREIKEVLQHLPIDEGNERSKAQVGFITYNNVVHFYNVKNSLTQPQMMIVGDLQEMFMPLLDGFLTSPEESIIVIDALMKQIPIMFGQTKETETILLPAIQAGIEALKASKCAGKLLVFNSSLPIADAPGKLRNRDDRKLLGTEKEKQILNSQSQAYDELGKQAVQIGCSVDLFIFNNSYIDLATIGQTAKLTGGEVYKYTYFQAEIDGHRLKKDLINNVSKPIAFDSVMRVRTSAGVRPTDFYGHFYMSNTTDLEIGSIDCDKAIAIEIKHDDKLSPEENVYIQIALLYTSCGGQRRLRILNLALTTTTVIADVFKSCDLDSVILFFAKQAMLKLLELTPKQVKDNVIHRSAQILAAYRKHCTSPTSAGQLILPECLKLLPLYVSCLLKNDAISGGADMTCDDRSFIMQYVLSLDLNQSVPYFYPRLIPIHDIISGNEDEEHENFVPSPIRCSYEKMNEKGAYILENGIYLFLWIGNGLAADFLLDCFGVQHTQQINTERFYVKNDTNLGRRVNKIIETIINERKKCMKVVMLRQQDKLENVYRHFLVEDRGTDGSSSYVDFLCHMHKEIKELLH